MITSSQTIKATSSRVRWGVIVAGITLLVLVLLVFVTSILTGYGFRLRSFVLARVGHVSSTSLVGFVWFVWHAS